MSNQLHQSNNYSNQAGGQPASPRQKKFCVDLGKRSCDVEHWTANQASTYIELMEPAHKQARFQNGEGCANGDDCETLLELIKGCKEAAYELINPEDAVLDVHKASTNCNAGDICSNMDDYSCDYTVFKHCRCRNRL
jgi:hypothetical protein